MNNILFDEGKALQNITTTTKVYYNFGGKGNA